VSARKRVGLRTFIEVLPRPERLRAH
jgi:hypothetical protein